VTSLSECIGANVTVEETIPTFLKSFDKVFDSGHETPVPLQGDADHTDLFREITGENACAYLPGSL